MYGIAFIFLEISTQGDRTNDSQGKRVPHLLENQTARRAMYLNIYIEGDIHFYNVFI